MKTLLRYGLAAIGPISSAGVQFALSLVLLHALPAAQFGSFSFLLVLSQFSSGIAMALFCAPLLIVIHQKSLSEVDRQSVLAALFAGNALFSVAIGIVGLVCGLLLGIGTSAAALFGVYAAIYLVRWYGRAFAYAEQRQLSTTFSDLTYTVVLAGGVGFLHFAQATTLPRVYAVLILGAAAGLVPFGLPYLATQLAPRTMRRLGHYRIVWKEHARWSLLGVLSTEATINAHAYLVTAIAGPAAFAPIAASALLLRPLSVGTNALSEFERARMARMLANDDLAGARRAANGFRMMLVLVWLGTAAMAAAILHWAPTLLFPARYDLHFLVVGACMWMVIGFIRMARAPDSALLQASGRFRPLAMSSMVSAGISVAGVLVLLMFAGPLWSILGLLAGEMVYAWRMSLLMHDLQPRPRFTASSTTLLPR
jgi:O-antigen/teichoic acid export membrane protein